MQQTRYLNKSQSSRYEPVIGVGKKIDKKYKVISQIGLASGQSDVYLCFYKKQQVVVKLYRFGSTIDYDLMEKLTAIQSPSIVPVLNHGKYKDRYYEVLPYYENGDLASVNRLDLETLKKHVIPFINEALKTIHDKGIVHMDLKPSNIFIDKEEHLHLGDFGIGSTLEPVSLRVTSAKGTYGYRPPESYSEASIKSKHFDYYSFGMTLIHLWKGESPYAQMDAYQIMANTMDGKIHIPSQMPQELRILIEGLTAYDKRKRIGYEEVKKWCEGKDIGRYVDLSSTGFRNQSVTEVLLFGERVRNLKDLAFLATASKDNWEETKKRCMSGVLDRLFEVSSTDDISILNDERMHQLEDAGVSKVFYKISDGGFIGWKDCRFKNIQDMAIALQQALPSIPWYFEEMYQSDFVTFLLTQARDAGYIDQEFLEYAGAQSMERCCCEIAYKFSNHHVFKYKDHQVESFEDLLECLQTQDGLLIPEINKLMTSDWFTTWSHYALGSRRA